MLSMPAASDAQLFVVYPGNMTESALDHVSSEAWQSFTAAFVRCEWIVPPARDFLRIAID